MWQYFLFGRILIFVPLLNLYTDCWLYNSFLISSFKMIDNTFIFIHVSCSNCICIGSLPSTFENSYLNILSTYIVLEPTFISKTSFIITFYYNGLYCAWQTNYLKQHFLVSRTVKINKTINM